MIGALMAIPVVEGVMGSVANVFSPPSPAPAAPSPTFGPYLSSATSAAAAQRSFTASPTGTMRADQWNQMKNSDVNCWMKSLTGRHVDATDETGRTISGLVNGMQQLGGVLALNIGGHLVSLSQLKQISWSPSVV
jgi:hypothetical protein